MRAESADPEDPGFEGQGRLRVSDAERDRIAEVLREAAGEGRLDLGELDERLTGVYAARTYADFGPLVADLPGGSAVAGSMGGTALAYTGSGACAGLTGEPLRLRAKGVPVSRAGVWTVPARVEASARFNVVTLDFREAELTAPVIEVWVDCSWGMGSLLLPEGATAEIDLDSSRIGTVSANVDSVRRAGAPHFVVTGKCDGGTLIVRHKRLRGGRRKT